MWILITVYALLGLGILLCFFGKIPGQLLAYAGLLVAFFGMDIDFPVWLLIVLGVLAVGSIVLNYTLVPKMAKKIHEFGKAGKWGTTVGSLSSIIVLASIDSAIVGLVVFFILPYLFAFIFEAIASKNAAEGAKRAGGAYTLFAASTILNLLISVLCLMEVVTSGKFFQLMFESSKSAEDAVEELTKDAEEQIEEGTTTLEDAEEFVSSSVAGRNKEVAEGATGITYTGTIADKYKITMKLVFCGRSVTGSYYYGSGKNGSLKLDGAENNGEISLYETNDKGEVTGEFKGFLDGKSICGTFTNLSTGKQSEFCVDEE